MIYIGGNSSEVEPRETSKAAAPKALIRQRSTKLRSADDWKRTAEVIPCCAKAWWLDGGRESEAQVKDGRDGREEEGRRMEGKKGKTEVVRFQWVEAVKSKCKYCERTIKRRVKAEESRWVGWMLMEVVGVVWWNLDGWKWWARWRKMFVQRRRKCFERLGFVCQELLPWILF
jgi:hypothetical protein